MMAAAHREIVPGEPRTSLPQILRTFEQELATTPPDATSPGAAVLLIAPEGVQALREVMGYGFEEEVLQLAHLRIDSALRGHDQLFRLPTDEFVVLLRSVRSSQDCCSVATRLLDLLHRPYFVRSQIVNISAYVGVVLHAENGSPAELLIHRAAMAVGCARAAGSASFYVFDPALEERLKARHALSADLHKALLLGQFEVHYQPQIDMRTRRLTGFEALLRWRHPSFGMVSPAEFIPIAESAGLIGNIGDWVLRTAAKQAAQLPNGLVMAVNASPIQFKNGSILGSVRRALAGARLAPSRLEIEITEGTLLQSTASVLSTLHELHGIGVRLAVDDFGTGYSSLGQLATLPVDTIKLDRSLVGVSRQQRAIVRAIVTLGTGIGMATLAEGLETPEEFESAAAAGCVFGQGYLFGKAIPASEITGVLSRLAPAEPPRDRTPGQVCNRKEPFPGLALLPRDSGAPALPSASPA